MIQVLINILIKCNYFTGNIKFIFYVYVSINNNFNVILMQLSHVLFLVCLGLSVCVCVQHRKANFKFSLSSTNSLFGNYILWTGNLFPYFLHHAHSVAYQKMCCIAFSLSLSLSLRISLYACTHFYCWWNQKFIRKWSAYGFSGIYTAYLSAYGKCILSSVSQRNEMIPKNRVQSLDGLFN